MAKSLVSWMKSPPPESPEHESWPFSPPAHNWLEATEKLSRHVFRSISGTCNQMQQDCHFLEIWAVQTYFIIQHNWPPVWVDRLNMPHSLSGQAGPDWSSPIPPPQGGQGWSSGPGPSRLAVSVDWIWCCETAWSGRCHCQQLSSPLSGLWPIQTYIVGFRKNNLFKV